MSKVAYVIFNKDGGEITGITNRVTEDDTYITVPSRDVARLKEGIDDLLNYHVQYNPKNKELELKSKYEFALDALTVSDSIYEIPELDIKDADVQLIQDIPNTCWKVQLGSSLKDSIKRKGINLNASFLFSITKKGDPNILYKTLSAHIGQTVSNNYCIIPFTMPFESTDIPISVFTDRRFDTYQLIRTYK